MLERTIDLQAIQARVEDCASYNFGMRNADQLAHVDAPDLLVALGQAEAERDGLLLLINSAITEANLWHVYESRDTGPVFSEVVREDLLEILTASTAQSLADHDAEVAATALDEATVLADSFGMISKRNLEPYWEGHDDAVDKIAQGIRHRAAEYRKAGTEGKL